MTGTPGVGKSALVPRLRRRGLTVVAIDELLSEPGVVTGRDRRRQSRIVDPKAVSRALRPRLAQAAGTVVVEGHLAHHTAGVTHALVLRLNPRVLARRLAGRGWPEAKVRENVEAEAIDLVVQECASTLGPTRAFELDVTGLRRHQAASRVAALLEADVKALKNVQIGRINWTQEILRWF